NEAAAVANLRTFGNAESTYILSSRSYASVTDLIAAGLIDSRFTKTVSGYDYVLSTFNGGYSVIATPGSTHSGRYGYYMPIDAVVRYQTATSTTCAPCFPTSLSGQVVQ